MGRNGKPAELESERVVRYQIELPDGVDGFAIRFLVGVWIIVGLVLITHFKGV